MLLDLLKELRTPRHKCQEMYLPHIPKIGVSRVEMAKSQALQEALRLKGIPGVQDPDTYIGVRAIRNVVDGQYTGVLGWSVIQRRTVTTATTETIITREFFID